MDGLHKLCSNIGYHDEGLLRDPALAFSALHSTQISLRDVSKRVGQLVTKASSPKASLTITRDMCRFFGDSFNNYVGEFTPKALAAEHVHLGSSSLSDIVVQALTSDKRAYNSGIKYPETLDKAEELGIVSKKTFTAFANLSAKAAQQEQILALELDSTMDPAERARIRTEMIAANIDFLVVATCFTTQVLRPNAEISAADSIDMELLHKIHPKQFDFAKGAILTYSNVACFNRILREQKDGRTEQDAVIAILERDGAYTDELKKQVTEVAEAHLHKKTIPVSALPEPLQAALAENQQRILDGINAIDGRLRRAVYKTFAKANVQGGVSNRIARVAAFDEGRHEALGNKEPRRF